MSVIWWAGPSALINRPASTMHAWLKTLKTTTMSRSRYRAGCKISKRLRRLQYSVYELDVFRMTKRLIARCATVELENGKGSVTESIRQEVDGRNIRTWASCIIIVRMFVTVAVLALFYAHNVWKTDTHLDKSSRRVAISPTRCSGRVRLRPSEFDFTKLA